MMRCIEISGSDNRMDCRDMFYGPLNALPVKCEHCGFPDLGHVPQPYLLVKSRTMTPNEMAPAENGNLLVRDRVRQVLELIAPAECTFYPTHARKTHEPLPWFLAVPNHQVQSATAEASIPRCKTCGQPRSAHPRTQYDQWLWDNQSGNHVLKDSNWGSCESGWDKWISRETYMSLRLFALLKALHARGLDESTCDEPMKPDSSEKEWIAEQLAILESQGIARHAPGTLCADDAKWYRAYLKKNTDESASKSDFKDAEKQLKLKLPKSYKDFIQKVGPCTFSNIDDVEGFQVRILLPSKFDTESYRSKHSDPSDDSINGVMFAVTEHGDCFCFDVQRDRKEYEIYHYNHEQELFEPFADNFAACIRRFTEGGSATP